MKGKYIVLEGIQGSGKTAQAAKLASWLRSEGIPVHITREPGGADVVGRTLRLLTQSPNYNLNTRAEVLLYNAARAQTLEIIKNLVDRGVWVICDRSYLTTLAIQYYARGDVKEYDEIMRICKFAIGDMWPDLLLVLDVPEKVAQERSSARYRGERFDSLPLDFLKRMRAGYKLEAKKRKLPLIDASHGEDQVFEKLKTAISKLIKLAPKSNRKR